MKLSEAIAALENGERVEYSREGEVWLTYCENTGFSLNGANSYKFRLKPKHVEPVTLWVNFYPTGTTNAHSDRDSAERSAYPSASRIAVPFREVVPLTELEKVQLEVIKSYIKNNLPDAFNSFLSILKKQGVE